MDNIFKKYFNLFNEEGKAKVKVANKETAQDLRDMAREGLIRGGFTSAETESSFGVKPSDEDVELTEKGWTLFRQFPRSTQV